MPEANFLHKCEEVCWVEERVCNASAWLEHTGSLMCTLVLMMTGKSVFVLQIPDCQTLPPQRSRCSKAKRGKSSEELGKELVS